MVEKHCGGCKQAKPLDAFHRLSAAKDGRQRYCRECALARQRARRTENPERIAAYNRAWREANPETAKRLTAAWREKNAERYAASKAAWQRKNRERLREVVRAKRATDPEKYSLPLAAWKAANRERVREYQQKRRAAGYGAPVSDVDLSLLLDKSEGLCGLCAAPLAFGADWPEPLSVSVDHIVPLSRGGAHDLQNMQMAHLVCNLRKGDRAA